MRMLRSAVGVGGESLPGRPESLTAVPVGGRNASRPAAEVRGLSGRFEDIAGDGGWRREVFSMPDTAVAAAQGSSLGNSGGVIRQIRRGLF